MKISRSLRDGHRGCRARGSTLHLDATPKFAKRAVFRLFRGFRLFRVILAQFSHAVTQRRRGDAGWGHPAYKGYGIVVVGDSRERWSSLRLDATSKFAKRAVFRLFRLFRGFRLFRSLRDGHFVLTRRRRGAEGGAGWGHPAYRVMAWRPPGAVEPEARRYTLTLQPQNE